MDHKDENNRFQMGLRFSFSRYITESQSEGVIFQGMIGVITAAIKHVNKI